MCGICGFTGKSDEPLLKRMCEVMAHRGPDQEGALTLEGISLGHRRLSIIDLSEQGRQPMSNEDATVWVAVNGEIYNYPALREELMLSGHVFRSKSDSEVIVHAYEEYGEDFVSRLEGMFAIALWDARENKLMLLRDRIGIKPLYYSFTGPRLIFASEIKAILEDESVKRELNRDGFIQYLAFQCIITEETMFKGIYKLGPASQLIFRENKFRIKKYWPAQDGISQKSNEEEVGQALCDSVQSHLISDVPVGVLLSGGLDSGSIVAIMHEQGVKDIETFTVGFGEPDDEFSFAREVAERFKTRHHEITVRPQDLKGLLRKIVWHMDEPLADGGAIATYLACAKVKEFVKVALVGEGGDEALAGYNWHRLVSFPLSLLPKTAKERFYFYLTTFYKGDSRVPFNTFLSLFEEKRNFLDSMTSFEIKNILPNSLLMKVDKMTMAHGLEARVPFLDHNFLSNALGFAAGKKISLFSTKIFLRKYMRNRLPGAILKRRKHGFIVPIGRWLKSELYGFCRETLCANGAAVAALFPRNKIEVLFKKQKGLRAIENNSLLWKLLIFEVWHREYLG